jgi:hypothetical protein
MIDMISPRVPRFDPFRVPGYTGFAAKINHSI